MFSFLTKKITRGNLNPFIAAQASEGYTLDLGCSSSLYAAHFPNRVGVDIQDREGVDVIADAHDLPFDDNTFDNILCTEVLEHLHTPKKAVGEMRRVLKPGGKLILTTRFIFPIHDAPYDYYRYTKYGLQHLFEGWKIELLQEEVQTSFSAIAVLLQTLANQSSFYGGKFTKGIVLLVARLFHALPRLTREELANGRKASKYVEKQLMTSGYYIVCKNTK